MLMVREIFKNAITCYVYIINAGIAAKATTEDGLTVTAAYPGTRVSPSHYFFTSFFNHSSIRRCISEMEYDPFSLPIVAPIKVLDVT